MRGLVLQLIRTVRGSHRQKRGIFNLVSHVAHSLFGTLDSASETFYNQNISQLEEEQLNWPRTDYCSVYIEIRKPDPK
jgi:hypothetical protein